MQKIKVMIVDDQPIIRDGLKMILSLSNEVEVVCTATNGEEAIEACSANDLDVVLMDIRMPVMDGVKATKLIKERFSRLKIIILTTFNDDEYIFDALKNGASSYMLKDAASEEIINSIKIIHTGGTVLYNTIATRVMSRITGGCEPAAAAHELTQREVELAKLVAEGLSNREIAAKLYITEGTVKNHITSILSKLNLSHRTQLALYIIENRN